MRWALTQLAYLAVTSTQDWWTIERLHLDAFPEACCTHSVDGKLPIELAEVCRLLSANRCQRQISPGQVVLTLRTLVLRFAQAAGAPESVLEALDPTATDEDILRVQQEAEHVAK